MLTEVWKLSWKGMAVTYVVLIIESLAFSFFPFYLGRAIDGLLTKDWFWFSVYLAVCVVGFSVGTVRRMFDTRVFGHAWSKVSSGIVRNLMANKMEPAKTITKAGLSSRFVDFFEFAVPSLISAVVGIITALGMLWGSVGAATWWLVLLAVLTALLSFWMSYKEKY